MGVILIAKRVEGNPKRLCEQNEAILSSHWRGIISDNSVASHCGFET